MAKDPKDEFLERQANVEKTLGDLSKKIDDKFNEWDAMFKEKKKAPVKGKSLIDEFFAED